MKNKGFTLIEMLVVVIINGVIIATIIPEITNNNESHNMRKYEKKMDIIKESTKLYVLKNKENLLKIDDNCIKINYKTIKNNQGIDESSISCSGNIILKKVNNTSFKYEYYIDCKDKENNAYQTNKQNNKNKCIIFP